MFGDPQVMPVKVIWDYTYYWGVLCQLFFQQRLTDLTMLARLRDEFTPACALNVAAAGASARLVEGQRASATDAVLLDQASSTGSRS